MIKKYKFSLIIIILVAILFIMNSRNKSMVYTTNINGVMDTITDITLITKQDGKKYIDDVSELIEKYDKMFSHTNEESDIYRLNHNSTTSVSYETYEIIEKSKELFKETNGSFDITVGAVSNLWNDTFEGGDLPDENEIKKALATVDYNSLNLADNNVIKTISSQKINLGAVAKGYIADKLKLYLEENKIDNALINLGGNIYAKGKNQSGKYWNVGVLDPNTKNSLLTLRISDKFVITSGNYFRYRDINSKRYHHIIDAKNGYPADNELNSVTIVSDNGFLGDALSTSCFLVGYEKSKLLLEKYDVCAIFVTKDNKIYYSKELNNSMEKTAPDYEFIEF